MPIKIGNQIYQTGDRVKLEIEGIVDTYSEEETTLQLKFPKLIGKLNGLDFTVEVDQEAEEVFLRLKKKV